MNLIIDIGNSLTKIAVYKGDEIIVLNTFEDITVKILEKYKTKYPNLKNAIISSVVNHNKAIIKYLNANFNLVELNKATPLPIKNGYKSPETLGTDRLAAAAAANYLYTFVNILVISAGTCITYDFVTWKAEYIGGAISPGIDIRFKALNEFTAKLPLIEKKPFKELIGTNTQDSILAGVINGVVAEANSIIKEFEQMYPGVKVVFSGGDMDYFKKLFKDNTFVYPNIVVFGLNIILNHTLKLKKT